MNPSNVQTALDFRYVLADGVVRKISQVDGQVLAVLRPKQTRIVQIEPIKEGIVIREDYYKFVGSNVYLVDYDFRELWVAQLASVSDAFANPVSRVQGGLSCGSWESWQCLISIKTGEIISKEFTK